MTNNPTIDGVSRERAADSLYLTMWPNDTLHECERGNPKYEACLKAVDAGYAKDAPAVERQEVVYQVSDGVNGWQDVDRIKFTACQLDPEEYECRVLLTASPEVAVLQSTIAQLQARIAELESGQGQPVAWQYRVSAGPATGWSLWHDGKGDEFRNSYQVENRPLYTAPPAPVAVVLPEKLIAAIDAEQKRLSAEDYLMDSDDCIAVIREVAGIDATAALNGPAK